MSCMDSQNHKTQLSGVGVRLTVRKECDLEVDRGRLISANPTHDEEGRDWLMDIRAGEVHTLRSGWAELRLQAVELTGLEGLKST